MKQIISTNPANAHQEVGWVNATEIEEISQLVSEANSAKLLWKNTSLKERVSYLKKTKKAFQARESEIVEMIVSEIGTARSEAAGEVAWDWGYWDWFLDNAESILTPEITKETESTIHKQYYEPIGTAAVITPWNLPFDMFVWGVIPNLLVGNPVIYKAAEECALSGQLYGEIMKEANLPSGVFSIVHGDGEEGQALINSDIDLIWFTGSSEVGKQLYQAAGKKFIRATLEMGGSNPAIVMPDADLEQAAKSIAVKRFMFVGQTCDADKRLIVHESVAKELISLLMVEVSKISVGDPTDKSTTMGPLVSNKQLELLNSQVQEASSHGAEVIIGGRKPDNLQGSFYLPTLLTNINPSMRVWTEEVFGPVLPIITYKTEEEAIKLANNTEYGLGSQIFSRDLSTASRIASQIEAGNVDINGVGHFIPDNPFGGYKNSGIGREHGVHGLRELCQIKTVSMPK